MGGVPRVLILGHSFVKRIQRDLNARFHPKAYSHFQFLGTAEIHLHGIGGRKVATLQAHDLHVVRNLRPEIVILEIGTNDLSFTSPEVVGSSIEELVRLLQRSYSVAVVMVCQVIPRGAVLPNFSRFFNNAKVLHQYLNIVLDAIPGVFCWKHRAFSSPYKDLYTRDGVHLNPKGQYFLYRSYRGAILQALSYL